MTVLTSKHPEYKPSPIFDNLNSILSSDIDNKQCAAILSEFSGTKISHRTVSHARRWVRSHDNSCFKQYSIIAEATANKIPQDYSVILGRKQDMKAKRDSGINIRTEMRNAVSVFQSMHVHMQFPSFKDSKYSVLLARYRSLLSIKKSIATDNDGHEMQAHLLHDTDLCDYDAQYAKLYDEALHMYIIDCKASIANIKVTVDKMNTAHLNAKSIKAWVQVPKSNVIHGYNKYMTDANSFVRNTLVNNKDHTIHKNESDNVARQLIIKTYSLPVLVCLS